jgi:ADP-ribose pyrophosphatase YjhB (NUDIX family)
VKQSIALVIWSGEKVLLVRRPEDDESLPGLWGLPAVSLTPGEPAEAGVRRAGRAKLGVGVRPLRALGSIGAERPAGPLRMTDWEAELVDGEPAVPQPGPGTQYTDWRWGEAAELMPAAQAGSLCCQVLLRELGLDWGS